MPYGHDFEKAATRHRDAGEKLLVTNRLDVAGYLFGIAAECALKQMMLNANMRPARVYSKDDPFWVHFPEILTALRDRVSGRRGSLLHQISTRNNLMQNWDVAMRYADGKEIQEKWVLNWRDGMNELITKMEGG